MQRETRQPNRSDWLIFSLRAREWMAWWLSSQACVPYRWTRVAVGWSLDKCELERNGIICGSSLSHFTVSCLSGQDMSKNDKSIVLIAIVCSSNDRLPGLLRLSCADMPPIWLHTDSAIESDMNGCYGFCFEQRERERRTCLPLMDTTTLQDLVYVHSMFLSLISLRRMLMLHCFIFATQDECCFLSRPNCVNTIHDFPRAVLFVSHSSSTMRPELERNEWEMRFGFETWRRAPILPLSLRLSIAMYMLFKSTHSGDLIIMQMICFLACSSSSLLERSQ